jgi:hypothetical protein
MMSRRWRCAVLGALAFAVVPGALRLLPDQGTLHRAQPWRLETFEVAPVALSVPDVPDAVPIIPPDDSLAGELAPARPGPVPFAAVASGAPGQVVALIVGIDDYPGAGSDLRSAVADADTVDAALAGFGVPAANRVVLRDGQARKAELVAAIKALVAAGRPDSTVVLAYAGHARKLDDDTAAIVAADGGLLTDVELASLLAPSPAQRTWLLLASCYAGGFTEALGPGRILTGAADADSVAYESPSINGSYLVHHLVREGWLEGRAGPSVQAAFAYADARISEQGPQRRPVQLDASGAPLVLGGDDPSAGRAPAPGSPSPGDAPPPAAAPPPTTAPERRCTLVVICRRS